MTAVIDRPRLRCVECGRCNAGVEGEIPPDVRLFVRCDRCKKVTEAK